MGLGFGDNAKAALLTRGLAEIYTDWCRDGSKSANVFGTCWNRGPGRNGYKSAQSELASRFMLGQGQKLDDVLKSHGDGCRRHSNDASCLFHLTKIRCTNANCGSVISRFIPGETAA